MTRFSAPIAHACFARLGGWAGRARAGGGPVAPTTDRPAVSDPRGRSAEADRPDPSPRTAVRLLLLVLLLGPGDAWSQDRADSAAAATANVVCVRVEIAGSQAGQLECAVATLKEAGRLAQSRARAGFDAPVPGATSPGVTTGVASQTATRQRLGSSFGRSVHPQRPNRPTPPPRPQGQP